MESNHWCVFYIKHLLPPQIQCHRSTWPSILCRAAQTRVTSLWPAAQSTLTSAAFLHVTPQPAIRKEESNQRLQPQVLLSMFTCQIYQSSVTIATRSAGPETWRTLNIFVHYWLVRLKEKMLMMIILIFFLKITLLSFKEINYWRDLLTPRVKYNFTERELIFFWMLFYCFWPLV